MSEKLLVPDIGDFEEVEVIEVLAKQGDQLNINDPVITIESDKSSVEIPSTVTGKIETVQVKVGNKVSKGDIILSVISSGENKKDKQAGSGEQHGRIDQGGLEFTRVVVFAFIVVGALTQRHVECPGVFSNSHRADHEVVEKFRRFSHGLRQGVACFNVVTQPFHRSFVPRRTRLGLQRTEGPGHGDTGGQHDAQLTDEKS